MADHTVQETFDRLATEYDSLKLLIIPKYDALIELVNRYIAASVNSECRVLELGTGTGQWAIAFLANHPRAIYEGVEFSEKMRQVAAHRLAPYGSRAALLADDLNEIQITRPYGLVVSFFTIHHVRDKAALFKKLYKALDPGGVFIYADITVARHQGVEEIYIQHWVDFMKATSLEEERIPMVLQDHWENDLPETVGQQLGYLAEAGFGTHELIWRHEKFAVFFGRR